MAIHWHCQMLLHFEMKPWAQRATFCFTSESITSLKNSVTCSGKPTGKSCPLATSFIEKEKKCGDVLVTAGRQHLTRTDKEWSGCWMKSNNYLDLDLKWDFCGLLLRCDTNSLLIVYLKLHRNNGDESNHVLFNSFWLILIIGLN